MILTVISLYQLSNDSAILSNLKLCQYTCGTSDIAAPQFWTFPSGPRVSLSWAWLHCTHQSGRIVHSEPGVALSEITGLILMNSNDTWILAVNLLTNFFTLCIKFHWLPTLGSCGDPPSNSGTPTNPNSDKVPWLFPVKPNKQFNIIKALFQRNNGTWFQHVHRDIFFDFTHHKNINCLPASSRVL